MPSGTYVIQKESAPLLNTRQWLHVATQILNTLVAGIALAQDVLAGPDPYPSLGGAHAVPQGQAYMLSYWSQGLHSG